MWNYSSTCFSGSGCKYIENIPDLKNLKPKIDELREFIVENLNHAYQAKSNLSME